MEWAEHNLVPDMGITCVSSNFGLSLKHTPIHMGMAYHFLYYDNDWIGDEKRTRYKWGFGDIDLADNLLLLKNKSGVECKTGGEIGLADALFLRAGRYEDISGKTMLTTIGFGVNPGQAVHFILDMQDIEVHNSFLRFLLHKIDMEYNFSRYKPDEKGQPMEDTNFHGVAVRLKSVL